jgi:pilus assembly protein CpaE
VTSPFSGHPGEAMPQPSVGVASGGGAPRVAVAVIDADQAARSRLAMQLGQGATPFPSINELATRLTGQPVVAVLGPSFTQGPELAAAHQLLAARREVGAIMVADQLTTDLLKDALRGGIKDVLQAPVEAKELSDAVQRVASSLTVAMPSGGPPTPVADDEGALGRVITVFSTKGGAGKSVIATNLAVLLARRSDRPVVLVDADLQFGDIAVMLKLSPQHTIVDAVGSLERLDASMLQSLLVTHQPSGLLVLPAPLEPAFADQIGAAETPRPTSTMWCSA